MSVTLQSPLDMHLHLREGAMLQSVAALSARDFSAAVIMPNLVPPVDSPARLRAYRAEIERATAGMQFQPLMTLFFRNYDAETLAALRPEIFAIKLYPEGVTTNSAGGVTDLRAIEPTLAVMADLGIPLLVHGESHGFVLDREREFLPVYRHLAQRFPTLTIVMEHITTAAALALLDEFPNLAATVTLHHLLITLDDVAGGMLQPHLFCKPIAKRPEDRDALLQAALAGHPRLMFGSDSAPHPIDRKEAAGCAAGVFTAPVILPVLVDLFERHASLAKLPDFLSGNAQRLHGLLPPAKSLTLERRPWQVPARYDSVVPYLAGTTLDWQVVERSPAGL